LQAGKSCEYAPDQPPGAVFGRFVEDGRDHQGMDKKGSGILENGGRVVGIDREEFAVLDAFGD
jgi:hypothetical protein